MKLLTLPSLNSKKSLNPPSLKKREGAIYNHFNIKGGVASVFLS